jgi:hypothetical protein
MFYPMKALSAVLLSLICLIESPKAIIVNRSMSKKYFISMITSMIVLI